MVSSELGACEWFVWDLRKSGLIDRGQLDQVIGEFLKRNPRAEPPTLAEYLVNQGMLSPFQAERILTGKTAGLVLGAYVLVDTLGTGSMGQVYKASSKTDNQWYAVKVLPRRSMWNVRLARRQVRAFSQFAHPGVVPFVDVGTSGGLHYLVWPLVGGETLESKVQREGKLAPAEAARVALQVAQALNVCHQNGIFHGLLKPSNIMLGADGQARLLDFGIGSLLAENEGESLVDTMSTANTMTSGLDCASPESIMEPTNRTMAGDQYSLGCILYYAVAGRYPFPDGTTVEKMMAHQFKTPTPLKEVAPETPEALAAVVERLMQKAPEARYAGADEMVEALQMVAPEAEAAPARPSHFGSQSHFGTQMRKSEPARANTPLPGPGGVPLPPRPRPAPLSASGGSVAQSSSPATTPVTPMPPARSSTPAAPPVPRAPKPPAVPTRQTVQTPPGAKEATPPSAPNVPAPKAGAAAPAKSKKEESAPGWVPEEERRSGVGPLLIVLIAALVTVGVYLLGKNFLFTSL
jgi:serine/threonine protein kinase